MRDEEGKTANSGSPAQAWGAGERRFKVFISYSRTDSADFAVRLLTSLEGKGLAAKLDTRDLEFGERWQAQLTEFIRQADAIVFIVSPRSISSKWCRWEVAQVAAQSKRLIPVAYLPVPVEELPPEIGDVHFFPFTAELDFDVAGARLAEVIQSDRTWLQEHTRLIDVAHKWATTDRSADHLLRGRALKDAERWIATRPLSAPAPSQAHFELIAASQSAAKKRTRLWSGGLATIAIGSLSLAVFAWQQKQTAQENEAIAISAQVSEKTAREDENAQRKLAQESEQRATKERDRALGTAYAARLNLARAEIDAGNLASGRSILESLIPEGGATDLRGFEWFHLWKQMHNEVLVFYRHGVPLTALSAHPSRNIIASVGGKRRDPDTLSEVLIWDLSTGEVLHSFKAHEGGTQSMAFSPDGLYLATGGLNDGTIKLWNWHTKEAIWSHDVGGKKAIGGENGRPTTIEKLAFTSTGDHIAINVQPLNCRTDARECTMMGFSWPAYILSTVDGSAKHITGDFRGLGTDSFGNILIGKWREFTKHRSSDGEILKKVVIADNFAELFSASPDGKVLAVGGAKIQIYETHADRLLYTLPVYSKVTALAFSRDGQHLFSGYDNGLIQAWRTDTFEKVGSFRGHTDAVVGVAPMVGARTFASAGHEGTVRVWSLDSLGVTEASAGNHIVVSPDQRTAVVIDESAAAGRVIVDTDRGMRLFDTDLASDIGQLEWRERSTGPVHVAGGFTLDGQHLFLLGSGSETPTMLNVSTLAEEPFDALRDLRNVTALALSGNGQFLFALGEGKLSAVDTREKKVAKEIAAVTNRSRIAVSRKGAVVAVLGDAEAVHVYDFAKIEDAPKIVLLHRSSNWNDVGFTLSANGSVLVLGPTHGSSWTQEVRVVDVESEQSWVLDGGAATAMRLSDNGEFLATASVDGAIRVFAIGSEPKPLLLHELKGARGYVNVLHFSPDGSRLFSGGEKEEVKIWDFKNGLELYTIPINLGGIRTLATTMNGSGLLVGSFKERRRSVSLLKVPSAASVHRRQLRSKSRDYEMGWWDASAGRTIDATKKLETALSTELEAENHARQIFLEETLSRAIGLGSGGDLSASDAAYDRLGSSSILPLAELAERKFRTRLAGFQKLMGEAWQTERMEFAEDNKRSTSTYSAQIAACTKAQALSGAATACLSRALIKRGEQFDRLGKIEEAHEDYKLARKYLLARGSQSKRGFAFHDFADAGDDGLQLSLATVNTWLGDVERRRGNRAQALKNYEEGVDILDKLARDAPGNADRQGNLAVFYSNLGHAWVEWKDFKRALAAYEKSVAIRRQLADAHRDKNERQTDLAFALWEFAEIAGEDAKEAAIQEGLATLNRMSETERLTSKYTDLRHKLSMLRDKSRHGWLGVGIANVPPDLLPSLGPKDGRGALVARIASGSAAELSGLRVGDVVLSFDGHTVHDPATLMDLIAQTRVDQNVPVQLIREGAPMALQLVMGRSPAQETRPAIVSGRPVGRMPVFRGSLPKEFGSNLFAEHFEDFFRSPK